MISRGAFFALHGQIQIDEIGVLSPGFRQALQVNQLKTPLLFGVKTATVQMLPYKQRLSGSSVVALVMLFKADVQSLSKVCRSCSPAGARLTTGSFNRIPVLCH